MENDSLRWTRPTVAPAGPSRTKTAQRHGPLQGLRSAPAASRGRKRRGLRASHATGLGKDPYSDGLLQRWGAEGVGADLRDDQVKAGGDLSAARDSDRLGLGYQYPFSKRTSRDFSLQAHEKVKVQNGDGSEKGSFKARGVEVAVRHDF